MKQYLFARCTMLALLALAMPSGGAHANQAAPVDPPRSVQGDGAWGVYGDLVGKTWLVIDKMAFNSFYIVNVRQERDQIISESTLYTANVQIPGRTVINRLPDGRLQGEGTNGFGTVASDGSVVFSTRSAFGREKVVSWIRRVNGEVVSLYAAEPKRPFVYNEISDDEIPQLVAQWNERREARKRERAAASQARWDHFNNALAGVTAALSEVQEVTSTRALAYETRPAPTSTATISGDPGTARPSAAVQAVTKPLRFVLDISMRSKAGDTVNPTCYSNVITRSGPPGWGAEDSLPAGSIGQARATVESVKARFIAACRGSGRDVTSDGDFHWTWNETPGDEQRMAAVGPRFQEDVLVSVD